MQHEMMRQPAKAHNSENVGDVLASIRRLIAQDESGGKLPNELLNSLPPPEAESMGEAPAPAVLKLDSNDLVAAETGDPGSKDAAPGDAPDIATPAQDAADRNTDVFSQENPWRNIVADLARDMTGAAQDGDAAHQAAPASDPTASAWDETTSAEDSAAAPHDNMTDTAEMEETMLHANASVTPINPAVEAAAQPDETHAEAGEPHLFARQDKDAQKGTHLRGMIREAIRQELQGEIGNRLSRNLQQMIRHEIELTLRQMCEQD